MANTPSVLYRDPSFPWGDFLVVAASSALAVALLMATVFFVARRTGRVVVVDTAWGLGFVLVALVSLVLGRYVLAVDHPFDYGWTAYTPLSHSLPGPGWQHARTIRTWGLLLMVGLWGLRLATHIYRRSRGAGEDPRYEELMARGGGGIIRKVLVPQGLAMWFVSLPVQMAPLLVGDIGIVGWLGVAVWVVGLVFETVGDAQLTAYRREPKESRPKVMDRGLWRYTRHPNYFGDACVWWGIWLVVADVWPGVLTVLSPVAMTFFLLFATGAKLLEKTMMKREGYPEYAARTSMFFPLPPKKSPAS